MTQIKVILTKDKCYTTFYNTIHAKEVYDNDTHAEDRYNDGAAQRCKSLAFSLATSCIGAYCDIVNWSDRQVTDADIFAYLNERHPKK